ncbi:hypothetical protein AX15_007101 [Amanita polypyramis BW_CC]|nr:hypothetical protein AX15_007101 [Amanita polypyramis BW_CC]
MFYSETILSRRGPLGKVWLAAHMERKLSKTQTLQTDIGQSVDAIMGQEIEVMALRLSGQLLLGVVRIYSRKAKYLLDDCNEALLKIKMAFRPGLVDMTDDQLVVSKNSITLPSNMVDLDLLLPDVNWNLDFERHSQPFIGHHQARVDDITLHTMDNFQQFDADPFDVGLHDGIGSQDFHDIDLGINWDDRRYHGNRDDISSLGVGRNASPRTSINSYIEGNVKKPVSLLNDRSPGHSSADFQNKDALDLELPTFESVDLGEFGVGFDQGDLQTRHNGPSGASSPLTELPSTPQNDVLDVNRVNTADVKSPTQKKAREKRQIVDLVTELQDGGRTQFDSGPDSTIVVVEQQFLRKSSIVLRLLEIHNNPIAHFFHGKSKQDSSHCGAHYSLGPELMQLFTRPTGRSLTIKRSLSPSGRPFSKRPRIENLGNTPEVELEYGRKDISPPTSLRLGSDILRRNTDFDDGLAGMEDQSVRFDDQMDVQLDNFGLELGPQSYPSASKSLLLPEDGLPSQGLEQIHNPEDSGDVVKDTCLIADFDLGPLRHSQDTESNIDNRGFSKNTLKALEIIRGGLPPPRSGEVASVLSFQGLSSKATRRAAASFFFELLVLGTRDCLHLSQSASFENIKITAKEKLWTQLSSD